MIIIKFKVDDISKELEVYENKLGVKLPEQYRSFLLKYNGGETVKTIFDINGYRNSIRAFFGFIDKEDIYSINNSNVDTVESNIKSKVILIGELGIGDKVAIGIGKSNYGQIFALDHEKAYKATKVGSSFNEFISQVKSTPINKDTLVHHDEKIRQYEDKYNDLPLSSFKQFLYKLKLYNIRKPSADEINSWWHQYNELINANYEEVEI